MAMKLYEIGRLTSGQAAVLAGIPATFLWLSRQHFGATALITNLNYTLRLEELHR